jgi:inner membrane transporter RhtA
MFTQLTRSRLFPLCVLLTAMISIQSGASLAKQIFPVFGPEGTTALRLLFASLMLLAFWRPSLRMSTRDAFSIIVYGAAMGCMNLMFYMALVRIPLGIAVALEFTGPLFIAFASLRSARDCLWIALAIIGIVLLLPLTRLSAPLDPLGAVLALAAGACWALYIIFGKKAGHSTHGGTVTALGMLVAALLVFPVGLWQCGAALWTPAMLPLALGVGLMSSAIPYSLEMIALKRLHAQAFSILMSMEPAIATLAGLVYLHEHIALLQCLAIGCVMAASAGSALCAHTETATPEVTA